jgi:hypothetical protein
MRLAARQSVKTSSIAAAVLLGVPPAGTANPNLTLGSLHTKQTHNKQTLL